jgi:hypothetical protein
VDGRAAVLLVHGPVGEEGLARWRDELDNRYGSVPAKHERGQDSWQWVRRNTMLRLTTRREGSARVASVSLVDGSLLDGLGPLPARGRP